MTLPIDSRFSGSLPPPPVLELTMEQQFQMRKIQDLLGKASREDMETVFISLQHQCYILSNNIKQLIHLWPTHPVTTPEDLSKSGTSSGTKS